MPNNYSHNICCKCLFYAIHTNTVIPCSLNSIAIAASNILAVNVITIFANVPKQKRFKQKSVTPKIITMYVVINNYHTFINNRPIKRLVPQRHMPVRYFAMTLEQLHIAHQSLGRSKRVYTPDIESKIQKAKSGKHNVFTSQNGTIICLV